METEKKCEWWCCNRHRGVSYLGVLLLLLGGFSFARDLGWIDTELPFWPTVAITVGLFMIVGKATKK